MLTYFSSRLETLGYQPLRCGLTLLLHLLSEGEWGALRFFLWGRWAELIMRVLDAV
jgi:hypothetical protein